MSSGGEPLSPELEAKVIETADELIHWQHYEVKRREILRAFAREILTSAREVAPERPNSLQPFDESAARSELTPLESVDKQLTDAREAKDTAYEERNRMVAALAAIYPSSLERHPDEDTTWEDDWRWIVFVALPTGQASWHLHDSQLGMFDHVERMKGWLWDGHTTGQKYERLAQIGAYREAGRGKTSER